MTIETKIAKNGTVNYYVDAKRVSRETAIETADEQRGFSTCSINYDACDYNGNPVKESFKINRLNISVIIEALIHDIAARVYVNGRTVKSFIAAKFNDEKVKAAKAEARRLMNEISNAYIAGATEITISLGHVVETISEVDAAEYAITAEAQDVAVDAEIELANATDPLAELDTDEYSVSVAAQYIAEFFETEFAERAAGNYQTKIGREEVTFRNFKIVEIRSKKYHMAFSNVSGRKMFYHYNTVIARKKIAEWYTKREQAAAQDKIFCDFSKSVPDNGRLFEVWFNVTYADGQKHHFGHIFDYFTQAQEYVDAFKKLAADNNCKLFSMIKRPGALGHIFYECNPDASEEHLIRRFGREHVHGNEYYNLNEEVDANENDTDAFSLLPDRAELNDVDDDTEISDNVTAPETTANVVEIENAIDDYIVTVDAQAFAIAAEIQNAIEAREAFFKQDTVEVGSFAEAMTLIENVTADTFTFRRTSRERRIRDLDNKIIDYGTVNQFEGTANHNFTFEEHFVNGEFHHVELWKGFNLGARSVKIFIKAKEPVPEVAPLVEIVIADYAIKPDAFDFAVRSETDNSLRAVATLPKHIRHEWLRELLAEREAVEAELAIADREDDTKFAEWEAANDAMIRAHRLCEPASVAAPLEAKEAAKKAAWYKISDKRTKLIERLADITDILVELYCAQDRDDEPTPEAEQSLELSPPSETPLDELYHELAELNALRDLCLKSPKVKVLQLQALGNAIERLEREIEQSEFDERNTVCQFCKTGSVIDDYGEVCF